LTAESQATEEEKKVLEGNVTQYSRDLQWFKRTDNLVELNNDALADLEEIQIVACSLIDALDGEIIPVPAVKKFKDRYVSLTRSRRRLGRQEYVEVLKRRPNYAMVPGPWAEQEQEDRQATGVVDRVKNWWNRGGR